MTAETAHQTDPAVLPVIDREICMGHGRCYMTAPDLFDSDGDGFPHVLREARTAQDVAALRRAMANCPEHAISSRSA
jgi:ferredoxin